MNSTSELRPSEPADPTPTPDATPCRLARVSRQLGLISLFALPIGFLGIPVQSIFRHGLLKSALIADAALLTALAALPLAGLIGLAAVVCGYAAAHRIAKSRGACTGLDLAKTGRRCGWISFSFIGCLTTVVLIGYLIASPTAHLNGCISSLRILDGCKEQWALENKKTATDTPTWDDMVGTDKYTKIRPSCPAGGTYTIGDMSHKPVCSIPGHSLP